MLSVVIPAAMVWIFLFVGRMNAAADRIIDVAFPIRVRTKTSMIMVRVESMKDFVDFPRSGTLRKAGTVTFAPPMRKELDTLLVRFAISGKLAVSFMNYAIPA